MKIEVRIFAGNCAVPSIFAGNCAVPSGGTASGGAGVRHLFNSDSGTIVATTCALLHNWINFQFKCMGAIIFMMQAKGIIGVSSIQYVFHCGLTTDSYLLIHLQGLGSIKLCNYETITPLPLGLWF